MLIRAEQPGDHATIAEVIARAFADVVYSDQSEARIVAALRDAGALSLSLVAEDSAEIVGHIAFSAVTVDGESVRWFGLGPVSVRPDRQRRGIGDALVRHGLDALHTRDAAGCVVLGDPAYYRRFGFLNDSAMRYPGGKAAYFMRLSFDTHAPAGQVDYHPAFEK